MGGEVEGEFGAGDEDGVEEGRTEEVEGSEVVDDDLVEGDLGGGRGFVNH